MDNSTFDDAAWVAKEAREKIEREQWWAEFHAKLRQEEADLLDLVIRSGLHCDWLFEMPKQAHIRRITKFNLYEFSSKHTSSTYLARLDGKYYFSLNTRMDITCWIPVDRAFRIKMYNVSHPYGKPIVMEKEMDMAEWVHRVNGTDSYHTPVSQILKMIYMMAANIGDHADLSHWTYTVMAKTVIVPPEKTPRYIEHIPAAVPTSEKKARKPRKPKQWATVWVFTRNAEESGINIDEAWAKYAQIDFVGFSPVEIGIHPDDVQRAIEKWNQVSRDNGTKIENTCRVQYQDKPGYERYKKVY